MGTELQKSPFAEPFMGVTSQLLSVALCDSTQVTPAMAEVANHAQSEIVRLQGAASNLQEEVERLTKALALIADRRPRSQEGHHGPQWRCQACGHVVAPADGRTIPPLDVAEKHAPGCAWLIATAALSTR